MGVSAVLPHTMFWGMRIWGRLFWTPSRFGSPRRLSQARASGRGDLAPYLREEQGFEGDVGRA